MAESMNLHLLPDGELGLGQSRFIDLLYLWHTCLYYLSCCRVDNPLFNKYRKLVKMGSEQYTEELDLVRLVRRLRASGIALYYLLSVE